MPEIEVVRILMVDDHAIFRAGLRMLIEDNPRMAVVGEAGSSADALEIARNEQPDIVLLDLDLGAENGLTLLPELISAAGRTRVIVLTGLRNPEMHHQAVTLGAMGLVFKEQATEVLIKAIEKVNAGEVWLDRSMTASVLVGIARRREGVGNDPEREKIATLTQREREVIVLVGQGLKSKEIGERLFISEATVRNHLTSILSKLGLSDRFALALYAYRHNLAKPPQ